jgi:Lipase
MFSKIFDRNFFRAWEYFAESVYPGKENNFLATRCNSLGSVENGACVGKQVPMGHSVPLDIKGNYFLKTNSKAPFGTNNV